MWIYRHRAAGRGNPSDASNGSRNVVRNLDPAVHMVYWDLFGYNLIYSSTTNDHFLFDSSTSSCL
jgi:hypothetical protein